MSNLITLELFSAIIRLEVDNFHEVECRGGREQYAKTQRNLKLMLIYLALSPKYKLADNHKTKIDTFKIFFFINCKMMTAAAYNLQRISKM